MTTTTVSYNRKNSQYQLRIPKSMGDGQNLEDKQIKYTVLSKNTIEIEIGENTADQTTYRINRSNDGTYRVSLPKGLGDAMNLAKQKVKWKLSGKKKLKITKTED